MSTAAGPIKCKWCGKFIIRKAGAPWWYDCPRCKGAKSSSGYERLPRDTKYHYGGRST